MPKNRTKKLCLKSKNKKRQKKALLFWKGKIDFNKSLKTISEFVSKWNVKKSKKDVKKTKMPFSFLFSIFISAFFQNFEPEGKK